MRDEIRYGDIQSVLDQLAGAEIRECRADAADGLHICLSDGRIVVVVSTGYMGLHIYAEEQRELH